CGAHAPVHRAHLRGFSTAPMELRRLHSVEHDSVSYRGYSLDGSLPVGALPRLCRACRHRAQMEMDSLAHHSRVCPCIGRLFHQICPVVLGWLTASRWTTFAGASPRLSRENEDQLSLHR